MIVIFKESLVFVLELTVAYETNIKLNAKRKANIYAKMLRSLKNKYTEKFFINLSMGFLAIGGVDSNNTSMLTALAFSKQEFSFLIKNVSCSIQGTHYIFCMRSKAWS